MELTKKEFETIVLLYAANIDGKIHSDEVDVMLEKADETLYKKMKKVFMKMGDSEVIESIRANVKHFAATEDERAGLLSDIRTVISADGHRSPMEDYLYKAVGKIITEG